MRTTLRPGDTVKTTIHPHLMKIESIENDNAVCIYCVMSEIMRGLYPLNTLMYVRH